MAQDQLLLFRLAQEFLILDLSQGSKRLLDEERALLVSVDD